MAFANETSWSEQMILRILPSKAALAQDAANQAAATIRDSISKRSEARIIAATGASQFDFLDALTRIAGIDWKRVEMFHLDEYVGLSDQASASFCRYLRERLIDKVGLAKYHLLDGTQPPATVIDVAFVGVGENGHLAFNDPPADFDTEEAYMVVNLDENCRKQQLGEGWFPSLADVPLQAISMTIKQLMKAKQIIAIAPDARKANAIKACFDEGVSPMAPASILQRHPNTTLYLDQDSAALLSAATVEAYASQEVSR